MRIERHQVDGARVAEAREDFVNRIGRQVHSYSRAGLMTTTEWQMISDSFLDYLGALSTTRPDLHCAEARAVLRDAAAAAAGAVSFAAYYPVDSFHVFLDYPNFGMSYDRERGRERDPHHRVTAGEWLDAFCLAIVCDQVSVHGEAFGWARQLMPGGPATPTLELVDGLLAYFFEDDGVPDGSTAPVADLQPGLRVLRALAAGDREAFDAALLALLRDEPQGTGPASLLPLVPIALAALAYRTHGWTPSVDTDYLPHALITGFETAGPRVRAFGRDPRPDALAALAAGPVHVGRTGPALPCSPENEARLERLTLEAVTAGEGRPLNARDLTGALRYQTYLLAARASECDDATDAVIATLRRGSQLGAAVFRAALAEPGTETEATIDGRALRFPARRDRDFGPALWQTALSFALITGSREDLEPLVLAGPTIAAEDRSPSASYRTALHDHLRGADPLPATERALKEAERIREGWLPAPAVLLSQLIGGDATGFDLALLDALEAHRDHHSVADRGTEPGAPLSLDVLALACHARRTRGWVTRVRSPYLPPRLLQAAGRT
ncbi:Immunity protein 49 [Streptomyces sp. TLI_053]|uniref:immunity 49 family protein n=1 Tax=Streptomyces sp. TLI_053 TaxID=1855352 RepID=UPI00087A9C11|nr:immunity 49 family protein [Streptomyces sp. TLI_053]SDS58291.1 Immunity protein 49 [Streptomyces sp. TLI_053]